MNFMNNYQLLQNFKNYFSSAFLDVEEVKSIFQIHLNSSRKDFQKMKMIQMDRKWLKLK